MAGIFLSCVSSEFHGPTGYGADPWSGSYRTQLANFLGKCGQKVVFQEEFAQGRSDLLAKLNDYISQDCKAVIHLIGHAQGWCLEDDLPDHAATSDAVHRLLAQFEQKGKPFLADRPHLRKLLLARNFHGLSVTHWEAYLAIHHDKTLLVFTFEDAAERHPAFQIEAAPPTDRVSQAQHLAWLRETNFDRNERILNQSDLKDKVIVASVKEGVLTEAQTQTQPQPRTSDWTAKQVAQAAAEAANATMIDADYALLAAAVPDSPAGWAEEDRAAATAVRDALRVGAPPAGLAAPFGEEPRVLAHWLRRELAAVGGPMILTLPLTRLLSPPPEGEAPTAIADTLRRSRRVVVLLHAPPSAAWWNLSDRERRTLRDTIAGLARQPAEPGPSIEVIHSDIHAQYEWTQYQTSGTST